MAASSPFRKALKTQGYRSLISTLETILDSTHCDESCDHYEFAQRVLRLDWVPELIMEVDGHRTWKTLKTIQPSDEAEGMMGYVEEMIESCMECLMGRAMGDLSVSA